jgi:mono/diheme cytochrome c family protein
MTKVQIQLGVVMTALVLVGCGGGATDDALASSGSDSAALSGSVESSAYRTRAQQGLAISPVPVNTAGLSAKDAQKVGYGSYLVNTGVCSSCHSSQGGFLAGGNPFFLDGAGHVVWSRNLTPDPATGMQLTEDQFMTAMRTGQDFHANSDGMMIVMPWTFFRWMSDSDIQAIYAYLKAIPPANNFVPPDNKFGMGLPPAIPFPGKYTDGDVDRPLPSRDDSLSDLRGLAIQPLRTPRVRLDQIFAFARGSYLVNAAVGCSDCHTNPGNAGPKINTAAYLTGGRVFIDPPPVQPMNHQARSMSADLLGKDHGFMNEPGMDYATFAKIMTTGTHADDSPPAPLAWPMSDVAIGKLVPDDLRAIWIYLRDLPANTVADKETQGSVSWCATAADCGAGESCQLNPATGGNECVGQTCSADADCGACDSCVSGACQPRPADDACYAMGM